MDEWPNKARSAFDVCQLGTNFKYSDDKDINMPIRSLHIQNKNQCKLHIKTWEMNVI